MNRINWIATVVLCALCCIGAQTAQAQMMYLENGAIVLDCGPRSGFLQGAVETRKGQKIASGTPSNSSGPLANNTQDGRINATVYHKLEIAKTNAANSTWAAGYAICTARGDGWRLPTQRELMLMCIFGDAIVGLGGNALSGVYWCLTESSSTNAWFVRIPISTLIDLRSKVTTYQVRCVREM